MPLFQGIELLIAMAKAGSAGGAWAAATASQLHSLLLQNVIFPESDELARYRVDHRTHIRCCPQRMLSILSVQGIYDIPCTRTIMFFTLHTLWRYSHQKFLMILITIKSYAIMGTLIKTPRGQSLHPTNQRSISPPCSQQLGCTPVKLNCTIFCTSCASINCPARQASTRPC